MNVIECEMLNDEHWITFSFQSNFKNDQPLKRMIKTKPVQQTEACLRGCEQSEPPTLVAGPVQWRVSAVVSQRGKGWWLWTGDAQQLAQPWRMASGCGQVDGRTTSRVVQQNRGFLFQQTLDALLLTTQQLGRWFAFSLFDLNSLDYEKNIYSDAFKMQGLKAICQKKKKLDFRDALNALFTLVTSSLLFLLFSYQTTYC